jgi:peptide/nickel transport system permease protein
MLRYTLNRVPADDPDPDRVAVLVFFMLRVIPGDVVEVKLRGDGGNVSQETIEMERKRLGLDKPLVYQFKDWMVGLATLDLGKSMWTDRPVTEEIAIRPRALAPGRRHGEHHRGAARDTIGHDSRP